MTGMHDAHATVELAAAVVLSLGGAGLLARDWFARRAVRQRVPRSRGGRPAHGRGSPAASVRRAGRLLAAVLSFGAAAIHLAAGPEHVEALGDAGLLFYWAALYQAALGVMLLAGRVGGGALRAGIIGNVALIAVWAWSRTQGLPFVPGGAEPVGVADAITVLLEMGVVALLVAWVHRVDTWIPTLAPAADIRTAATSGLVAVVGVAVLATSIAMADAGGGHHATDAGHHSTAVHAP